MKRALSILLTIALLLLIVPTGLFSITVGAATSGTTGECTWSLNGTVLTISGYGKMADYTYSSRAPWSNNGITKVIIRDGVTNIGDYAFYYHTYLENITIPDSVTSIGDSSFMDCGSLTSLEFPDGLTYIGEYAFCNDNITSVTIPDNVTYIGESAFAYNDIRKIVIPSKVTAIADSTFNACKSLTSVTMHDGIVSIGDDAFAFNNLFKIIIPDSVTYIGNGAFMWNENLYAVTIGADIKSISSNAFRGCSSLRDVYYRGSQTEKLNISIGSYNTDITNATWYYNSCTSTNYHTYTDDCDAECNVCSYTREAHVFTNNCDKDCNICGFIRVPSDHVYDNTCDMLCNVCGKERMITHTYSNDSDKYCDICGQIRGPYTITYHLDGGTNALKNPDIYTEEDVITLMDASKVGYDFAGWFLDADKTEPITEIYMMGSLELYAKFLPKTYSAIFYDNGATKSTSLTLNLNTVATFSVNNGDIKDPYSISIPQKRGYVFLGWYTGENLLDNPIEMDTNLTLTPKWSYCTQNNNGKTIILGENATKVSQGYGYSTIWDSSGATTNYSTNSTYIYISGGYQTIQYEGTSNHLEWGASSYYQAGETYGTFSIYDVTNSRSLVSVPVGYNSSRTQTGTLTIAPGTLLRITATSVSRGSDRYTCSGYGWISIGKKRTANISVANSRTVDYEFDSYINTPSVSKTGYKFLGWYDSQGNQMTDTWQYTEDQTFTAKWQPQNYDIIYELDGGRNSQFNPTVYTIEDTITLKDPTKSGYTFKGWYLDANYTTKVTSISKKTGNITLYAKWEVNSYNLTLDANAGAFAPKVTFISDGVEIKSSYLYDQDTITAYRPDNKEGYIFAGWYKDDSFTSLFKFNGAITNDITLYAKWVECESNIINIESVGNVNTAIQGKTERLYAFVPLVDGKITITSESNNLDLYGTLYDTSRNALISADDISNSDLDFTYTYDVNAGQFYYIAVKGTTASTVGEAVINIDWSGDCKITGTTYPNRQINIVYGTNYKLPQKPIREGYVFLGWFDENDTQITDGIWNFVTDKALIAKWEEATYHTVVFKDLDGHIISSEIYYISEDIVAPELPTKAPDETYIYHAKWNNGYTGVCTGDAVYSPIFDTEYIEYTVIFVDEDGTELSRETYHWGDVVIPTAAPTKAADNTYTYTFAGWDKTVINCEGDATYTATYTPTYIEYTVVFNDLDGTVLSANTYHYGDKVTAPADPIRAADSTYTYVFAGWDNEVTDCVGDATYTATYTPNYIEYTVIFKDWDGSILSSEVYHYGDKVTVPANPSRAADNTYTYSFAGWDREIADCVGDATYNATYSSTHVEYTVIFKDWNGNVLSTKTYHYGDNVVTPLAPGRAADNTYTYTFAGWDKTVINCEGDATYTATYTPTYIEYTVVFNDLDGTVLSANTYHYGDKVTAPADPTRAADNTYTYVFAGWDNEVTDCVGDATYTATYTPNYIEYTVIFKDWDGSILSSEVYHYGDKVTVPANPGRAADNTYTYSFAGWDREIADCVGDATYNATYSSTRIEYTVIFKDWNGSILSSEVYHYGDKVTVPANPSRAADNTYTYTFAGWDKTVINCEGDATYTATYTPTYIEYTVVFNDLDGTVLSANTYHYGDKVTAPADPIRVADSTYTYVFAGWDNEVTDCVGDATYTATYTPNYIEYTVIFKDWDGSILSSEVYHYGDKVTVPANPSRAADNTYTYSFAGWDKEIVDCVGDTTYTATYEKTKIIIIGDFDFDGQITVADALAALRIAAKMADETTEGIAIGDIDKDGTVTVADALAILRVAAKMSESL